jgi:putative transposase
MRTYTRLWIPGGVYFFTLTLDRRINNTLLIDRIGDLRRAVVATKLSHPFEIEAITILPEHLHSIWRLPADDHDFATRWRLIKSRFSRSIAATEAISRSRIRKGERQIWQRRYWEHAIRDQRDFDKHVDYIHFNPVKHGHVSKVRDWPYSSFHRYVRDGVYPSDWASPRCSDDMDVE